MTMSHKVLTVSIKNVYGNELIYPVCDDAKAFARIAGSTTLTRSVIEEIKKLGYTFSILPAPSSSL